MISKIQPTTLRAVDGLPAPAWTATYVPSKNGHATTRKKEHGDDQPGEESTAS
jgi:hypothetical protein